MPKPTAHDRRRAARKASIRGYTTHSIRQLAGWRRSGAHTDALAEIASLFGDIQAPVDAMPPGLQVHSMIRVTPDLPDDGPPAV